MLHLVGFNALAVALNWLLGRVLCWDVSFSFIPFSHRLGMRGEAFKFSKAARGLA